MLTGKAQRAVSNWGLTSQQPPQLGQKLKTSWLDDSGDSGGDWDESVRAANYTNTLAHIAPPHSLGDVSGRSVATSVVGRRGSVASCTEGASSARSIPASSSSVASLPGHTGAAGALRTKPLLGLS